MLNPESEIPTDASFAINGEGQVSWQSPPSTKPPEGFRLIDRESGIAALNVLGEAADLARSEIVADAAKA